VARIGPNAVIQLGETFAAHGDRERAAAIYAGAGCLPWLADPPTAMVEEGAVLGLFAAVAQNMGDDEARARLAEAGARTGDYIMAHRIPGFAKALLRVMPRPLALRFLLAAIGKHAWTFAGSGRFSARAGNPSIVTIADNLVATQLGCVWHAAVFRRLISNLLRCEADVNETCCCGKGADHCAFSIRLHG
jgi:divinyl protochlorophyllide a 8-vinyl-reductase